MRSVYGGSSHSVNCFRHRESLPAIQLSYWYGGPYLPRRYLFGRTPSNIPCSADVTHGAASLAHKAGFQTDEKALILAAQKGDQDAFGQLVRAYDQSVLRLAMNLLRSPEDAQDV